MSRFDHRSVRTELIDAPDVPFDDWAVCLHELNTINTYLGGHAITIAGVQRLLRDSDSPFEIAEIGCGGGDNLLAIERWNHGKRQLNYTGIDINQACVEFAATHCRELPDARFICCDYSHTDFGTRPPDVIFNSLFCHHFTNDELVTMLLWMKEKARRGFVINDLQRHPLAFHSIKWLTRWFSRSYLVRNDAPISVMRGFIRSEWQQLLERAGIKHYQIIWRWAFRYLVIVENE